MNINHSFHSKFDYRVMLQNESEVVLIVYFTFNPSEPETGYSASITIDGIYMPDGSEVPRYLSALLDEKEIEDVIYESFGDYDGM